MRFYQAIVSCLLNMMNQIGLSLFYHYNILYQTKYMTIKSHVSLILPLLCVMFCYRIKCTGQDKSLQIHLRREKKSINNLVSTVVKGKFPRLFCVSSLNRVMPRNKLSPLILKATIFSWVTPSIACMTIILSNRYTMAKHVSRF